MSLIRLLRPLRQTLAICPMAVLVGRPPNRAAYTRRLPEPGREVV